MSLTDTDIAPEALAAAKAVFQEEVKDKPEEMREKILEGKLAEHPRSQSHWQGILD